MIWSVYLLMYLWFSLPRWGMRDQRPCCSPRTTTVSGILQAQDLHKYLLNKCINEWINEPRTGLGEERIRVEWFSHQQDSDGIKGHALLPRTGHPVLGSLGLASLLSLHMHFLAHCSPGSPISPLPPSLSWLCMSLLSISLRYLHRILFVKGWAWN